MAKVGRDVIERHTKGKRAGAGRGGGGVCGTLAQFGGCGLQRLVFAVFFERVEKLNNLISSTFGNYDGEGKEGERR